MGIFSYGNVFTRLATVFLVGPLLSGCFGNFIPSLQEPSRLYSYDDERARIHYHLDELAKADVSVATRNEFITARMYAIDLAYTQYESQFTHESQDIGFLTTLTNLGLTSTAALIPVAHTSRLLAGIASGVTGAGAAYNEKILLSNVVQNLEAQMRTDRNDQAAIIYQNMKCDLASYPVGLALTDLETYYRAGTVPSALIGLTKTVGKAETDAKANKDSKNPAPSAAATAQLKMTAAVSTAKAQGSAKSGCRSSGA